MTPQTAPGLVAPAAWVIPFGLGAGNIGDELLHRAMWQRLDAQLSLAIGVFDQAPRQRGGYPGQHRYYSTDGGPLAPGLLIGGTITEAEGVDYPLRFLAPHLRSCHDRGLSVDALGVGVDPIASPEARRIFAAHFAPIRRWFVRTTSCRDALLDLDIPADRIQVAADWAWLYKPSRNLDAWARDEWVGLGWDPRRPLAVVNLVRAPDPHWFAAFKELAEYFQLGFAAQEVRPGFDQQALECCRELGLTLPLKYYSPDEMIALIRPAAVAVAQRYHFAVEAMLAGVPAILLGRPGRKMYSLAADVGSTVVESAGQLCCAAWKAKESDVSELSKRAEHLLSAVHLRFGAAGRRHHIAVLHVGGLGDLVLAEPFISALHERFERVTLICRKPVAHVTSLFPKPPHEVIGLDFNPYLEATPSVRLDEQLIALRSLKRPDVLVSAEFRPTWLSWFLVALLEIDDAFISMPAPAPHGLLTVLLSRLGLTARPMAASAPATYAHERDRYAALARLFSLAMEEPRWPKPPAPAGFHAGEYIVCFPGGAALQRVKTWGPDRFREVLQGLSAPVVIAGDQADEADLRAAAPPGAAILVGSPDRLPELAALTANARAYLANDTGPAHLAQAYGVPGLTIYGGGGGWPVYSPWGPAALGIVRPLDCFGCEWSCAFDRAYCLSEIPVDAVRHAFAELLRGSHAPLRIAELPPPDWWHSPAMAGAATRHREVRVQLDQRMQALVEIEHGQLPAARHAAEQHRIAAAGVRELRAELSRSRQVTEELRATAEERLAKLDAAVLESERLRAECDERARLLQASAAESAQLARTAVERGRLLEACAAESAELARTAAERLGALESLSAEMDHLRRVATERNAALFALEGELSALRDIAEQRRALLENSQAEAESLRAIAQERERLLAGAALENANLLAIAEERAKALEFTAAEAERRREILEELTKKLEASNEEPAVQ